MNKPVGTGATRIEPVTPVVLVPKAPPVAPAAPISSRIRKSWLIAGAASLAVLAGVGIVWWLSSANGSVSYTT
ncbi:MAG TPA: hypothetical protein VGE92_16650, partial [Steroidobacteraceae bacterium]